MATGSYRHESADILAGMGEEREKVSDAGRELAAQRRRVDTACEVCGTALRGVTSRRRYCSNRCKLVAVRGRRHDAGEERVR